MKIFFANSDLNYLLLINFNFYNYDLPRNLFLTGHVPMLTKLINFVKIHQADIILVVGVILISLLSFAMGYITAKLQ